jgi:hypothetical protein
MNSMKTNSQFNPPSLPHLLRLFLCVATTAIALCSQSATVLGQIYVTNAFANTLGKYALDGALVSDSLVTGLDFPFDIAVFGDNIFVANFSSGVVGKYTTDGATVDASLITGFPGLTALTVSDGFLYVVDAVNGTVGKYNLDGTVVDAGLVMGLGSTPEGIAISGTDLFVANPGNGTIGKYTTDGAIINRDFIIDVPDPRRLAVHSGILYVSNFGAGSISTYDAATGATLDPALVTGLSGPLGIALSGDGLSLYVANRDGNTIGLFPSSGGGGDPTFIDTGLSGPSGLAVVDSLLLTSAVSRKTHGAAGTFDINLPLAGEPGLECRNGAGKHKFVFFFNNTVVSGGASVTLGTGTVLGSPIFSGNTMTVNLTGVADVQKITVTLTDVTDTSSRVLPSTDVSANMLIGDTSADKIVGSFDVRQTRLQVGVPVTSANFREDVKPDGSITSTDVRQVRSRVGNSVP